MLIFDTQESDQLQERKALVVLLSNIAFVKDSKISLVSLRPSLHFSHIDKRYFKKYQFTK